MVKTNLYPKRYKINGIYVHGELIGDRDTLSRFFNTRCYSEARIWFNLDQINEFMKVELGDDSKSNLYYLTKRKQILIQDSVNFVDDSKNDFRNKFEEKWFKDIWLIMKNWKKKTNKSKK